MRIISGKFRGLQLKVPGGLPVRPTTDFAKTGLFNILTNRYDFDDCDVLDLYAGTGSLSFEFISRGAKSCTAVDKDRNCVKYIRETINKLDVNANLKVVQSEVLRYLNQCTATYDIIVSDPPYAVTPAEELSMKIFERELLKENGVFILEHASEKDYSHLPNFLEFRKYGQVGFSFFGSTPKQ